MDEKRALRGKQVREWATLILAALSILIALRACSLSKESKDISARFGEINAEVQWNNLLTLYNEVDDQIRAWEESKGLKRDGAAIENQKQLEEYIKESLSKYRAPSEIVRCYKLRSDRYDSLKNVSKRYEAVKERLQNIDFALPTPPRRSGGAALLMGF